MDTATALESDTMRSLSLAQRSMSIVTSDSTYSARGESLDKIRSDDTQADIRTGKANYENSKISLMVLETSLDSDFQEESSICSPMSTTEKPLILAAKRAKHDVGDRLEHILRASFAPVAEEYPTESILRLAIWWLLKARIVRKLLMQNGALRRKTDASLHEDAWESTISAEQAHADLLKASWILEEGVLANADDRALTYTNIRRIIKNIAASVHQDLSLRRDPDPVLPPLGEEGILKHDLALLESFEQNIEAEENVPNAIDDDVTGFRWMEIDQDNAGLLHERVKYRTFVNAQIGSRNDRLKSSSAPYMLLLWTTAEESDLMVSLCNQRGTVNLSRRLTAEDLEKYDSLAELKPFVFDFPSQDAEIMFLTTQDFLDFLKLPKSFYEKMRERGPRSEELAIFQATLSTYADISGQRHPSDDQAQSLAGDKHSSCGLRLYESISDKCWKTTRRLVISASPNSPNVRCVSHWLPLENVRITTTDAKVTVAWSDCAQLTPKSKGNYDEHFAYEYRAEEPNRKIHLKFRHSSDAQEFAETLLYPTELPPQVIIKSEIATNFSNTRIYRLFDTDEPNQQYHAIVSTRRSPKGPHCTEIFYTYRDLDWTLQTKSSASMPSAIAFERLQTAHHISTITRTQAKPAPGDPSPEFASTTESSKRAHLELACDHDLANLIRGVFGWQLAVYLPVPKLVLIDTSRLLRNTKEALRNVAVQLYRKSAEQGPPHVQLAVRLEGKVKDRWITMVLAENSYKSDYHTFEIGGVAVRRGVEVDTKYMCATKKGAETGRVPRGPWKVAITFESSSGESGFWRGFIGGSVWLMVLADKDEFMRNSGLQSTMRLD